MNSNISMNQEKIYPVIKCPHCGHGYAPAELFHPTDFAGYPTTVLRDALGKILYQEYREGYEPALSAEYICDGCNKKFLVEVEISYKSKKESEELDFSETTVSLL